MSGEGNSISIFTRDVFLSMDLSNIFILYQYLFPIDSKIEGSFFDEGLDGDSDSTSEEEDEDLTWLVDREIRVMSELDHPHIVHLEEVYEDQETACFVMELAKGGEVFDRLIQKEFFDEIAASNLVVQVLNGRLRIQIRYLI